VLHLATSEPQRFRAMLASDVEMKPSHATRLRRFLEREGELFIVERIQPAGGASTTLKSLRAAAGDEGPTFGEEFGAYVSEQTTEMAPRVPVEGDEVLLLSDSELDSGATIKYGDKPDDDGLMKDWGGSTAFAACDTSVETLNAAFLVASATARAPTSPALGKQKRKPHGATPAAKKRTTKQAAAKISIRDATGLSFQLDAGGCALNFDSRCVPAAQRSSRSEVASMRSAVPPSPAPASGAPVRPVRMVRM
jgi:hypothetical protein